MPTSAVSWSRAELGILAGIEDEVKVKADEAMFTNPDEVEEFVEKPGWIRWQ